MSRVEFTHKKKMNYSVLLDKFPCLRCVPKNALIECLEDQSLVFDDQFRFKLISKMTPTPSLCNRLDMFKNIPIFEIMYKEVLYVTKKELNLEETHKLLGIEREKLLELPFNQSVYWDVIRMVNYEVVNEDFDAMLYKLESCKFVGHVIIQRKKTELFTIS